MSDQIVVTLPIPPASLSPNGRASLRRRLHDKSAYRSECGWLVKLALPDGWEPWDGPVRIHVVWQTPNPAHFRDHDNAVASLKAGWDGTTDAGLWRDDRQISGITVERVVGPRGLTVTFTREEQP